MASIPVVTQRQVLPSSQPYPMNNNKGHSGGIIIGRSMQAAGQDIATAAEPMMKELARIKAEDDKREFTKLDIEYSAFLRTLTYGDGTPENPGYLNTLGENALNAFNPVSEQLTKKRAELLKKASNKEVADMFGNLSAERMNTTMSQYADHASDERHNANNATTKARIEDARMAATTNYKDLDESLVLTTSELTQWGLRNGLSADVVLTEIKKENAATIESTILSTIPTNTGLANRLLAQYGDKLDGLTAASILDKIETQQRQNMADYERAQRMAKDEAEKVWEKNLTQNVIGIERGAIKDKNVLVNQLEAGQMDYKTYFIAENYFDEKHRELNDPDVGGDPEVFLEYRYGMTMGTIRDPYGFMAEPNARLNTKQKTLLLGEFDQKANTDPILSRADVENGRNMVVTAMVGEKDAFSVLSSDDKAKSMAALAEYDARSYKEHKATPDLGFQQDLAREILAKYTDKLITQTPPATWPPDLEWGGPDTGKGLVEAHRRLLKKRADREISDDAFFKELEKIIRLRKMQTNSFSNGNIQLEGQP